MKVTIGNKIYDSEAATKLAAKPTQSSCQELHQTAAGDFFLFTHQVFVDGNRLGPNELWIDVSRRRYRKRCAATCWTASKSRVPLSSVLPPRSSWGEDGELDALLR